MATAAIVFQGYHRLRYLITAEGTGSETVSIATIGGATPDTLTDSLGSGVIKTLSKVVADGFGLFAAGAQTQAKARALWLSDWAGADPGNPENQTTAECTITPRDGAGTWVVDANVSANNPVINVTVVGGGTAYLDIEARNVIGA